MTNKRFNARHGISVGSTNVDIVDANGNITANTILVGGSALNSTSFAGTANNATYFGAQLPAYYTNASNLSTGTINELRLPTSGVIANTYGNSSQIPVITVDTYGRVTTLTTSAVAGVTSFSYSAANTTFTLNTGDGSTYTATIGSANSTSAGVVTVLDSVTNTSSLIAASVNSVKTAYDTAIAANTRAASAQTAAISAYSNATSFADLAAANAYSNAVSTAALDATAKAGNAYSNAVSFATTVSANAYANAVSTASTDATNKAANAYSNAVSYAATIAGTAYTNAVSVASTDATNKAANAYSNAVSVASTDATNKAANAYSNAVSYAGTIAATAYSNAVSTASADATSKAATAYSNAVSTAAADATSKAATAYSNAVSYASSAAGVAYVNATAFAANASNINSGTLAEARLPYRMNQNVRNTDNVEFHNMTVSGNLTVSGTTVTINANNLSVEDNMIYLNDGNTVANPDLGIAGNYNDGTYRHAGFFRDATDGVWKVFDQYLPEPDASPYIDTSNASFRIADFQANAVTTRTVSASGRIVTTDSTYDGAVYVNSSSGSAYVGVNRASSGAGQVGYNWRTAGTTNWFNYMQTSDFSLNWYNNGLGAMAMILDYDGNYLTQNYSVRSPIFYDSNNTGYYVDAASTSSLNAITTRGTIQSNEGASATDNNSGVAVFRSGYAGTGLYRHSIVTRHNSAANTNNAWDFYLWRPEVGSGTEATHRAFIIDGGEGTTSAIASRSPIFYDSNNTAYYADPTGTSQFVTIETRGDAGFRAFAAGSSSIQSQIYFGNADNTRAMNWQLDENSDAALWGYDGSSWGKKVTIGQNRTIEQGNNYAHPEIEWSASGGSTGMVIFYLPGTTSNYGMVHMVFDIYEYVSGKTATVIIGGHNWTNSWYETGCQVIGLTDKSVRLGVKGGRFCVVFGGVGSSWNYGTIRLRKIHNGSFYDGIMNLAGNWSTEFTNTESFTNISGDLRQLRTTNTFTADGDVRSPIFYDSNNTGYYIDPNSSSVLYGLRVANSFDLTTNDVYASMRVVRNTLASGGNADGMYIGYGNGNSGITRIYGGGSTSDAFQKHATYSTDPGSFRAPIYYDSENTEFYIDPNNTSQLSYIRTGNVINIGGVLGDASIAGTNFHGIELHSEGNRDYYIGKPAGAWTQPLHIHFYTGIWYRAHSAYGGHKFYNLNDGTLRFSVADGDGHTRVYGSLYSPIYYDIDNTGYYVDPASSTYINNLGTAGSITVNGGSPQLWVSAGGGYQRVDARNDGTAGRLHWYGVLNTGTTSNFRHSYYDGSAYIDLTADNTVLSIARSGGAIVTSNGSFRAPIFYDTDNTTYFVDPSAGTSLRTVGDWRADSSAWTGEFAGKIQYHLNNWYFQAAGTWEFRRSDTANAFSVTQGGVAQASSDFRAPIFYDSSNTGYYIDPNSTSALSGAILIGPTPGGAYTRFGGGAGDTTYSTLSASNGNLHIDCQAGFDLYLNWYSVRPVWSEGGAYFPIYYDRNNTAYYFDGASLTRANQVYADYISVGQSINTTWRIITSGTTAIYLNGGGYGQAEGSWRAPIFYDSDNTGYFINPVGSSYVNIVHLDNGGAIVYNDRGRDAATVTLPNWLSRSVRWDFVTAATAGTGGNYAGVMTFVPWDGTAASTGDASYQLVFGGTAANSSGVPQLRIRKGIDSTWNTFYNIHHDGYADMFATSSFRAPIFYDSNNTAFYFDGASTTNINELSGNGKNIFVTTDSYLRINQSSSFPSGCWFGGTLIKGEGYFAGSNGGTTDSRVSILSGGYNGVNQINVNGNDGNITVRGVYARYAHNVGFLQGGYNNIGASEGQSSPIYCIGSSYVPSTTSLSNMYGIGFTSGGSFMPSGASGWGLYVADNGNARIFLSGGTGDITATGNITAYASDRRLKTNITPITNALDKLMRIRGVEFDWINNIEELGFKPQTMHETGVIAQEIQAVIPDAVKTAPFNNDSTKIQGVDHNYLTVDKEKIIPLLIEAIKEQQLTIAQQSAKINTLEDKLDQIIQKLEG